ncbi:hypothetical protein GCM10010994_41370 [Chelatococcus reniformis]|uniref:Uncharacterized protein n=2 Tax=Chelatococcus reniformis TaxID=1494448 RepID=A0A916UMK9_9HYPH|nr:hypothetical protein GCM10010994_41370 [Chelatococcus reniformis]
MIVCAVWSGYKELMTIVANPHRLPLRAAHQGAGTPARVILHDHTRLPGRFFGRLTASVQAELRR